MELLLLSAGPGYNRLDEAARQKEVAHGEGLLLRQHGALLHEPGDDGLPCHGPLALLVLHGRNAVSQPLRRLEDICVGDVGQVSATCSGER
eukprot:scaffold244197_cov35-Prasinocladus_malaysianus.AAC.2